MFSASVQYEPVGTSSVKPHQRERQMMDFNVVSENVAHVSVWCWPAGGAHFWNLYIYTVLYIESNNKKKNLFFLNFSHMNAACMKTPTQQHATLNNVGQGNACPKILLVIDQQTGSSKTNLTITSSHCTHYMGKEPTNWTENKISHHPNCSQVFFCMNIIDSP